MSSKICCLYIRVSTMDQVGGAESQTRALTDWATKNGIQNFEIFADHGISGDKESRPSLNRMMQKVEEGLVEQIVVFAFSRFARSATHLLKALEKFREKSVRFHSITEALDANSPMGIALFTILGCLSQLERELIRERVIAGMKNAKAKVIRIDRVRKRNSKCSHGSVHAQKIELKKRKVEEEKKKFAEMTKEFSQNPVSEAVEQMKAMKISDEMVLKVQTKLESDARENVRKIQSVM